MTEFYAPRADILMTVTGEKDATSQVQLHHFQGALHRAFGDRSAARKAWLAENSWSKELITNVVTADKLFG